MTDMTRKSRAELAEAELARAAELDEADRAWAAAEERDGQAWAELWAVYTEAQAEALAAEEAWAERAAEKTESDPK